MEPKGSSRTAINTAMARAAHLVLDDEPKVLADTFARALAGYNSDADLLDAIARNADASARAAGPRMRLMFALRNRYAEDALIEAMSRGVEQYIILGAGLDSFAYRRPDLMESLDVFEVDHPASQAWKRARVAQLGIVPPARLHHLRIDFERETLREGLARSDVDLARPMFFSLLGVAQYLTTDALLSTLQDVVTSAEGGAEIVLQHVVPAAMLAREDAELLEATAAGAAKLGEPWLGFYAPSVIEHHLLDAGFDSVVHFGPDDAAARYPRDRGDGRRLPAHFAMVHARLSPRTPL
jgi:methyltransferase (TIGR00027 family)